MCVFLVSPSAFCHGWGYFLLKTKVTTTYNKQLIK